MTIFAASGILFGAVRSGNVRSLLFSWAGLSAGLLLLLACSPAAWNSNLAPLAIFLFPIQALPFLFAGFLGYAVRQTVLSFIA